MRGKRKIDFINERSDIRAFLGDMKGMFSQSSIMERHYVNSLYATQQDKDDALKEMRRNYKVRKEALEQELESLPKTESNAKRRDDLSQQLSLLYEDYTKKIKSSENEPIQQELDQKKKMTVVATMGPTSRIFNDFTFQSKKMPVIEPGKKPTQIQEKTIEEVRKKMEGSYNTFTKNGGKIAGAYKARFMFHLVAFRGYAALKDSLAAMENPTPEVKEEIEKTLACYRDNMIANGVHPDLIKMAEAPETKGQETAQQAFETALGNYFADEAESKFEEYINEQSQKNPDYVFDLEKDKVQRLQSLRNIMNPDHILYIPASFTGRQLDSSFGQMLIDSGDPLFVNQVPGKIYESKADPDFNKMPTLEEVKAPYDKKWEKKQEEFVRPTLREIPDPEPEPPIELFDAPPTYRRDENGMMQKLPYPNGFFAKIKFFFTRFFGADSKANDYNLATIQRTENRNQRIKAKADAVAKERKEAKIVYDHACASFEKQVENAKEFVYRPISNLLDKSPEETEKAIFEYVKEQNEASMPTKGYLEEGIKHGQSFFFDKVDKETEELTMSLQQKFAEENVPEEEESVQGAPSMQKESEVAWNELD